MPHTSALRQTLARHLGNTLTPEVAAAVETSAAQAAAPSTLADLVGVALKGNAQAVDCFLCMRDVLHFWDDLVDGDRRLSVADINAAMFKALVTLPNNQFYRQHQQALSTTLVSAIGNWHAANQFEGGEDERLLHLAYVVRSDYANLLIQAAYLVGGYDWMMEMTPVIRSWWTKEDFAAYKSNLQRERLARGLGSPTDVVRGWYEEETSEYIKHGLTVFNAAMMGDTEEEHVDKLIAMTRVKDGDVVVDMGCGAGGVSRLMRRRLPASEFYCVTNVPAQIWQVSEHEGLIPVYADYHKLPLKDAFADVVMFNETIGYGDLDNLLLESARVLKPGGLIAIKDVAGLTGKPVWSRVWQWMVHPKQHIDFRAKALGLEVLESHGYAYSLERYRKFIQDSDVMRSRYGALDVPERDVEAWFWLIRKP